MFIAIVISINILVDIDCYIHWATELCYTVHGHIVYSKPFSGNFDMIMLTKGNEIYMCYICLNNLRCFFICYIIPFSSFRKIMQDEKFNNKLTLFVEIIVFEWTIAKTYHKFFQVPFTGTYQRIQSSFEWWKGEETDLGSE